MRGRGGSWGRSIPLASQCLSSSPSRSPVAFLGTSWPHPATAHPTDPTESCGGGMWQNITELHSFPLLHLTYPSWHTEYKPLCPWVKIKTPRITAMPPPNQAPPLLQTPGWRSDATCTHVRGQTQSQNTWLNFSEN